MSQLNQWMKRNGQVYVPQLSTGLKYKNDMWTTGTLMYPMEYSYKVLNVKYKVKAMVYKKPPSVYAEKIYYVIFSICVCEILFDKPMSMYQTRTRYQICNYRENVYENELITYFDKFMPDLQKIIIGYF
jgi:hypothetical protein